MDWKGYGRKHLWPNFRYYPRIFLEEHGNHEKPQPGKLMFG
jgi:hypothetical protein